jgi:hypothetical protein
LLILKASVAEKQEEHREGSMQTGKEVVSRTIDIKLVETHGSKVVINDNDENERIPLNNPYDKNKSALDDKK